MAMKRISKSSVDWVDLAKRVPAHQKQIFGQFKLKSDVYLMRALANPESLPKIDWEQYKKTVPVAGMVDDFQKQYSAITIPYPPNTVEPQLDAIEKEVKQDIANFKKESDERIAVFQKKLDLVNSLIPFDQMTMDDFYDIYPDLALDPLNKPTFWPHTDEDRLDYVPEGGKIEEKH